MLQNLRERARHFHGFWWRPALYLLRRPRELAQCAKLHRRARAHGRFLATLPRSGTNYLFALLNSADHVASGLSGDYFYDTSQGQRGKWVFSREIVLANNLYHLVQASRAGHLDRLSDRFFVSSHYPAIRKTRLFRPSAMKPVFTVRDVVPALESLLFFTYDGNDEPHQRSFLENDLPHALRYLNYWGKFAQSHHRVEGKHYVCVRYESLVENPLRELSRICRFWDLDLPESCLREAVQTCDANRMRSKVPSAEQATNKRISVRDRDRPAFSGENRARLAELLRRGLRYDFGYDVDPFGSHEPGQGLESR